MQEPGQPDAGPPLSTAINASAGSRSTQATLANNAYQGTVAPPSESGNDGKPSGTHLVAASIGIASKYFGTITCVFGEAAAISWMKDGNASRAGCCEASYGARK